MSLRAELKALLEHHGLWAKRSLGQNFLIQQHVFDAITQAALRSSPKEIIEIGAGPGLLTAHLGAQGPAIFALERDDRFVEVLSKRFEQNDRVQITHGDALEVELSQLANGPRPSVVGNLPYNISTPILLRLLDARSELGPATVMLQREVAQRLAAQRNTKAYGSLSVLFQTYASLEKVCDVAPDAFIPKPTIWSTVLHIEWRAQPAIPVEDQALHQRVVRAAFSQRRKMLRNSLRTAFDPERVQAAAAHAQIELTKRAEALTLEDFGRLAEGFSQVEDAAS